jgi:HTH-type transcriptional regulator, glycine betaine synthesis regulator
MAPAPQLVRDASPATPISPLPAPGSILTADYESGLVAIFADLAELFGNPKSYGEIFGLLFAHEEPLTMEEIAQRLEISQGSISQGLRQLESFGAVVKERNNGTRQALYTAKLEMKLLIAGFLKERVIPRLESTEARVKALRTSLNSHPSSLNSSFRSQPSSLASMRFRLNRLAKWHRSARTLLPIARKILGGG